MITITMNDDNDNNEDDDEGGGDDDDNVGVDIDGNDEQKEDENLRQWQRGNDVDIGKWNNKDDNNDDASLSLSLYQSVLSSSQSMHM